MVEVLRKLFMSILLIGLSGAATATGINPDWVRLQFYVVNGADKDQTISIVDAKQDYSYGGGIFDTDGIYFYGHNNPRYTYSSLDKEKIYDDIGNNLADSDKDGNLKHLHELKEGVVVGKKESTVANVLLGNVSYHWNSKYQTYYTNVKFRISATGDQDRICDFKIETYPQGNYCYDWLAIHIVENIKNDEICKISKVEYTYRKWLGIDRPSGNMFDPGWNPFPCNSGRRDEPPIRVGDRSKISIEIKPVKR